MQFSTLILISIILLPISSLALATNREFKVTVVEIKDEVWPKLIIEGPISADPLTAVALYYDLDNQHSYIPDLPVSLPIKHLSPTEVHTYYERQLPWPFDKGIYVNGTILEKVSHGHRVTWYQVFNPDSHDAKGSATFVTHPEGTWMTYETFVRPKSLFAGMIKKIFQKETVAALYAMREHVESVSKHSPTLAEKYRQYILQAYQGMAPFEPSIKENATKIERIQKIIFGH
ncbi:MAG: hypothetical protein A2X86_01075 [Bdellovibrionales bacterium GWA2_49_15]|nr:MAG: hypothetical protein A2X86_01075 [Bdellovibrionales bacterium GWA2_49_15]HAZ12184.1 hypothetical protein [Bdellovibrionales bacterium]